VKRYRYASMVAVSVGAVIGMSAAAQATGIPLTNPISHTAVWEDPGLNVICGIENKVISKTNVLCQGPHLPRPPHSNPNEGDPAVTLAATGKPQLVAISQDSYPSTATPHTLGAGRTWSARGVTCKIGAHGVTCRNGANHGISFRNGHYKSF
jgi:hypothetical protein